MFEAVPKPLNFTIWDSPNFHVHFNLVQLNLANNWLSRIAHLFYTGETCKGENFLTAVIKFLAMKWQDMLTRLLNRYHIQRQIFRCTSQRPLEGKCIVSSESIQLWWWWLRWLGDINRSTVICDLEKRTPCVSASRKHQTYCMVIYKRSEEICINDDLGHFTKPFSQKLVFGIWSTIHINSFTWGYSTKEAQWSSWL